MNKNNVRSILTTAVISVAAIFLLLYPQNISAVRSAPKDHMPNPAEKGAVLYEKYCAICHGAIGEGYVADEASALSNQDYLKSASDEYIIQGILRGRPGTPMSAWGKDKGGELSAQDAAAILSFFRSWQKEPSVDLSHISVTGNAENGENIYQRWCAACHGKQGEGETAITLNNPVFLETASDGFIRYTIENGRRNTRMSAYRSTLSAKEIDDVVAYIKTFKTKPEQEQPVAVENKELSDLIREKAVLNAENPPAVFSLVEDRYVPADDVFEAYKNSKSFIIIDARPPSDYIRSHIKGAVSIPFYDIKNAVGLLPKDIWIITYCVCPHALSGRAADRLKAEGYDKVAILDEGFFYWQKKGYPSESSINSDLPK